MMKRLLTATAVVEIGAGVALMCVPAAAAKLLLGVPLEGSAALTVARIGAAGLLALGVACWLAHYDAQSRAARGLVAAMLVYNIGAVAILGAAGIRLPSVGVALWPAVALHVGLAIWCVASVAGQRGKT
jgi:hypothetical protein